MIDPNQCREACESYLSRSLGDPVTLVNASQLTQGTREAPWKLGVAADGTARSYVLQLDERGSVTRPDLGDLEVDQESAEEVLEAAWDYFNDNPQPLAEVMYRRLKETQPDLPPVRFSNGDLWLDNFIVKGQELAGVIDFQRAGFSDPIFEFLLSFFVEPKLQGRRIEERFCRRLGYDPAILHWYHGLEFFDTWRAVLQHDEPFVHHTAESFEADIKAWLG